MEAERFRPTLRGQCQNAGLSVLQRAPTRDVSAKCLRGHGKIGSVLSVLLA